MSALPTLNIPVVVNTAQVEPAMKKVEKSVADSAARISRTRAAIMPGLGALGAGPLGGVLGGISGMGMGGLGVAGVAAAFMAPILLSKKLQESLDQQTKGSTEAFTEFKKTGMQTAQINSVLLERLSRIEKETPVGGRPMGFGAAFGQAERAVSGPEVEYTIASFWEREFTRAGAVLGTLIGGGSLERAFLEGQLSVSGEGVAKQTASEIAALNGSPLDISPFTMFSTGISALRRVNEEQLAVDRARLKQEI